MDETTCSVHGDVRLIKQVITNRIRVKRLHKRASTRRKDDNKKSSEFQRGRLLSVGKKTTAARSVPVGLWLEMHQPAGSATFSNWLCFSVPLTSHL